MLVQKRKDYEKKRRKKFRWWKKQKKSRSRGVLVRGWGVLFVCLGGGWGGGGCVLPDVYL